MTNHVERKQTISGHGSPKLFGQRCVKGTQNNTRHFGVPNAQRSTAEVHGGSYQDLIHGQGGAAIAANACLVAKRLSEGFAKTDADILHGVVGIDVQIAFRFHRKVHHAVAGKVRQHMVEETDASGQGALSGAVEVESQIDACFRCFTLNASGAWHAWSLSNFVPASMKLYTVEGVPPMRNASHSFAIALNRKHPLANNRTLLAVHCSTAHCLLPTAHFSSDLVCVQVIHTPLPHRKSPNSSQNRHKLHIISPSRTRPSNIALAQAMLCVQFLCTFLCKLHTPPQRPVGNRAGHGGSAKRTFAGGVRKRSLGTR